MIVTCPSCGRMASVSQAVLGKPLKCSECSTEFTINTAQVVELPASDRVATRKLRAVIFGMLVCIVMWLFPPLLDGYAIVPPYRGSR